MTRWVALGAWLAMMLAHFVLAPPTAKGLMPWLTDMMMGRIGGENPLLVAEFYTMGVWPLVIATQLRRFLVTRPVPAWPFVVGSMFLGCFVLPVWFLFPRGPARHTPVSSYLARRGWRLGLMVITALLWIWGIAWGDTEAFLSRLRSDGFIFVMTVDFFCFWAISLALTREKGSWAGIIPIFGALARVADESGGPG